MKNKEILHLFSLFPEGLVLSLTIDVNYFSLKEC
jgi:hypothetical protein